MINLYVGCNTFNFISNKTHVSQFTVQPNCVKCFIYSSEKFATPYFNICSKFWLEVHFVFVFFSQGFSGLSNYVSLHFLYFYERKNREYIVCSRVYEMTWAKGMIESWRKDENIMLQ